MQIYRTGPETDRLEHRALTLNDAEAFYALNSNVEVMKFTGEPMTQSVEEARQAIADYRDFDERGYGRWACVLKETQQVIGFCGLKYLTDLNEVDVGYRFLPEFWGKGLATEACAASIRFGFDTLGLEKIIGLVLPPNTASIRVLEKVGMTSDGEFDYDGLRAIQFSVRRETW